MAAYVDAKWKLWFYDPDVGEARELSSTNLLPLYLKNFIDLAVKTQILHPDKILTAKALHPNKIIRLPSMAENRKYTFWEYQRA